MTYLRRERGSPGALGHAGFGCSLESAGETGLAGIDQERRMRRRRGGTLALVLQPRLDIGILKSLGTGTVRTSTQVE